MSDPTQNIVILGATGAVGTEVVRHLCSLPQIAKITVLVRRPFAEVQSNKIEQHVADVLDAKTYAHLLDGHDTAICTLGVGAPSTVSKDEFQRIDRDAVIDFGAACKAAGIRHFQLLSSVGVSPKSRVFFLRTKGELEAALSDQGFDQLSLFHPSNIITPTNRYGVGQGIVLWLWPKLKPILAGPLRKYRGIKVADLGKAIAENALTNQVGVRVLEWDDFHAPS